MLIDYRPACRPNSYALVRSSCVARESAGRYGLGASEETQSDLRNIEADLAEAEQLRASAAVRLASVRARGDGELTVGMSLAQHLRHTTLLRRDNITAISVLGDVLGDLPSIKAALAAGRVNVDQAAAIGRHAARVGTTLRRALDSELSNEPTWQRWDPEHLAAETGRILASLSPHVAVEREQTEAQREFLHIQPSFDGQGIHYKGYAEGLNAVQMLARLDAASADPKRGTNRGPQLAAGLAKIFANCSATGDIPPAVIHLLIDEATATEGAAAEVWTSLPGFAPTITAHAVRKLAPKARTITSVTRNGVPIAVLGRAGNAVDNPDGLSWESLDELVRVRDGNSCRMPGCDRPLEDVHHLVHRNKGGRDRVSNLAGLCKRCHHRVLHGRAWKGRVDSDGRLHLRRHGQALTSPARKHLRLRRPPPLADPNAAAAEHPTYLDTTGQPLPF